jgi:hypothetical protein
MPVQFEEGLVVAVAVEESTAPSPPAAVAVVGEDRVVTETTDPQAASKPQAGISSGGDNVVRVPVDQGAPLPPLTRERDVAEPAAPETSAVGTTPSIGGAEDMSMSRYLTIPGIWVIDLDVAELPSNDREILEAVTDRVFADSSLLDAIASGLPAPRQDGDAGGFASSAVMEAVEEVLGGSAAGAESATIALPLPTAGVTADAPLLQTAETAVAAPPLSMVGAVKEVVGAAEPSSTQPAIATEEEAPALSQPIMVPQEQDAPEGTTRAASPEIQEVRESSGAALC